MDVIEAIYSRRAIREYADEVPAKQTIEKLIRAASHAPSAMNRQPWAFAVVSGRSRLLAISDRAKALVLKSTAADSALAGFRSHLADATFDLFYGAPVLIVICATSAETGASEDCALAAQNLMLAAHSMNLGTCWIGLARPWLNEEPAKTELGLPKNYIPVAPVILGYPRGTPDVHPRREPEIVWIG
ncbi:MAG: nitroreductase [Alphaproteobacteria bacterium]